MTIHLLHYQSRLEGSMCFKTHCFPFVILTFRNYCFEVQTSSVLDDKALYLTLCFALVI